MLETACPQAVHLLRLTKPVVLTLGTGPMVERLASSAMQSLRPSAAAPAKISWLTYTLAIVLMLYFLFVRSRM